MRDTPVRRRKPGQTWGVGLSRIFGSKRALRAGCGAGVGSADPGRRHALSDPAAADPGLRERGLWEVSLLPERRGWWEGLPARLPPARPCRAWRGAAEVPVMFSLLAQVTLNPDAWRWFNSACSNGRGCAVQHAGDSSPITGFRSSIDISEKIIHTVNVVHK